MARTSEPKRMKLSKKSQYLGLHFLSLTVYLDILHKITVTIQNMSLVYYAHLRDMTISYPHLLHTRPKQAHRHKTSMDINTHF